MPKHALFTEGSSGGKHRLVNEALPGGQHKFWTAGALPIVDTFNRADSSTRATFNPASDGGTWLFPGFQTFGVMSNRAYAVTGGAQFSGILSDTGHLAADVTLTFYTTGYYRGCINFAASSTTSVCYSYQPWRSSVCVSRFDAGGIATDMGVSNGDPPSGTVIRVTYDGINTIKVYWNGTLKQTIVDSAPITDPTCTWVGISATQANGSTGETWDNFSAV